LFAGAFEQCGKVFAMTPAGEPGQRSAGMSEDCARRLAVVLLVAQGARDRFTLADRPSCQVGNAGALLIFLLAWVPGAAKGGSMRAAIRR
jgi:hypothetical protein